MSKAYICDRCGKVVDARCAKLHEIWLGNPEIMRSFGVDAKYHLCDACFMEFERFFENLNGDGECDD